MRKILALVLSLLWAAPASAQIVGTLPFTLQNGTIADANQVMSDLNTIVAAVNANAANAGVNTNINALNNLTTPLVYTSGGTSNYIGGTSGGSANAQTIASPIPSGFTLVTGKSVTFIAGFTNTGPTQLNVAGTGLINVFHQGVSGPVALSGNEIGVGNIVTATFDGTQYQIGNASPQSLVAPCTVIDWVGANGGPSGYLLMNGQTPLRTAFSTLFGCITVQGVAATTTLSSASVVVPNSALFQIGWSVGGANVTCNSTITAIPDGTHITISATASAGGATTLTIGPYSQGDCSTTFAVGNLQGRATVMRDPVAAALTAFSCPNPASIGTNCGAQSVALQPSQIPTITSATSGVVTVSVGGAKPNFPITAGTVSNNPGTPTSGGIPSPTTSAGGGDWATGSSMSTAGVVSVTSNNTGAGSHAIVQPSALVDKYIKF